MRLKTCLSRLSVGATVLAGAMAMAGMASAADKKYQFYLSSQLRRERLADLGSEHDERHGQILQR